MGKCSSESKDLRLLLLPVGQNLDYDFPVYGEFFTPQVFGSFLLLATLLALAAFCYRRGLGAAAWLGESGEDREPQGGLLRLAGFGIFWFFITLSVESSVIPIRDVIFEHRLYLPSVGAALLAASCFGMLRRLLPGKAPAVAAAAIVLALGAATWERNEVWADPVELWKDALAKSPSKVRVLNNLGMLYGKGGETDLAIEHLRRATRLSPGYADAHFNLGRALSQRGELDEAIGEYRRALALNPDNEGVRNSLGVAYEEKGWTEEALAQYRRVLDLNPENPDALNNLGSLFAKSGETEPAIECLEKAVRLDPDLADGHYNLGLVYRQQGRLEEAIEQYRVVLALDPGNASVHNNLGSALFHLGEFELALREFRAAVEIDPGHAGFRANLSLARERQRGI